MEFFVTSGTYFCTNLKKESLLIFLIFLSIEEFDQDCKKKQKTKLLSSFFYVNFAWFFLLKNFSLKINFLENKN